MAILKVLSRSNVEKLTGNRHFSSKPRFGLLFDIDGVLVRGKRVLPPVPEAFKRLRGEDGKFRVPTVFVTNSGNALRSQKAADLSKWIGMEVSEDQVIMAHSPLRMFERFHDNRVLISGQGPVREIARELGFRKTTTMDELVKNFPSLNYVNMNTRDPTCGPVDPNFPGIEAIVLLSEPINWETGLQLMVDLMLCDGMPTAQPSVVPHPHIPVMACNMDLLWVSEAPIPRYGHGAFLACLETLYRKITGKDLVYTALIGKPSEVTYLHANLMILRHARSIGVDCNVDTIYAIGDNINTDVFGANLYDKQLARYASGERDSKRSVATLVGNAFEGPKAKACISVLVETGVHGRDTAFVSEHSPRDFLPVDEALCKPAFVVDDVGCAIDLAFKEEKFN